jgi:hypothetical protein
VDGEEKEKERGRGKFIYACRPTNGEVIMRSSSKHITCAVLLTNERSGV